MPRRVIFVTTAPVPETALRSCVRAHAGDDVEVYVVAPASAISRLDWLTNADGDARADAAERADQAADVLPVDDVETHVGDSDPLLAIEDALRSFAADEIVIVTRPDEQAGWLESGSGAEAQSRPALPVTHLVIDDQER